MFTARGIWPGSKKLTADGWELTFAVNHLAPFRINALLQDDGHVHSLRIIQIGAGLAIKGKVDTVNTPTGEDFGPVRTYINTKLWNALATFEWTNRWPDADICSIHPGVIRTELGARSGILGKLLRLAKTRWQDPADSIHGIRYLLACDPAQQGVFLDTDGRQLIGIGHRDRQGEVFDATRAMVGR